MGQNFCNSKQKIYTSSNIRKKQYKTQFTRKPKYLKKHQVVIATHKVGLTPTAPKKINFSSNANNQIIQDIVTIGV